MTDEGTASAPLERLVEAVGAFGPFQAVLTVLVYFPLAMVAWSMLLPSFGAVTPDWWCVPPDVTDNVTFRTNVTFKLCPENSSVECVRVYAEDMFTIISQYDLQCEKKWVAATTSSVQMAGVLVGALLGGQAVDMLGRKKSLYSAFLAHTLAITVSAFSVSWQMFAALRFFVGVTIGACLVVFIQLPMEYVGSRWRPLMTIIPSWTVGISIFALTAWLLRDVRYVQLACAVISLPFLLGWFVVPESMRWLAVQGRLEEAERAVDKMARFNRRTKPSDTRQQLALVAEEERAASAKARFYSYHDLFRDWKLAKVTIINCFIWFSCSLVFYAIYFGVQSLGFNLYLNIFLMGIMEEPGAVSTFFLSRSIGRRWTAAGYFFLTSAAGLVVVLCDRFAADSGAVVNAFALVAKLALGAAWRPMITLTNESYPTVIRGLAYAAANTASRVAGIIAPLILFFSDDAVYIPYIVVCVVMAGSGVLTLGLKETKDLPLADTLTRRSPPLNATLSSADNHEKANGGKEEGVPLTHDEEKKRNVYV